MNTTLEDQVRSIPPELAAFGMVVGITIEKVSRLPKEDRDDLYKLATMLASATTHEEKDAAYRAILEIILGEGAGHIIHLPAAPKSENLQKWSAHVGDALCATRKEKGLTQEQLAEKSGVPQSHISRLENGKHCPSSATIDKLAEALGVHAGQLDPSRE